MPEETLLDLPCEALGDRLSAHGYPGYRADQIWHAVFQDLVGSFEEITTLPGALRAELALSIPFPRLDPVEEAVSRDRRTRKTLLRLADGATIESVTMSYLHRRTVCVSSQVGCAVGCPLCATGKGGFVRDLTVGEIVAQVVHAARGFRDRGGRLTNIVYMGMGEPFLNYDATVQSIRILNDRRGLNLSARSFTVSTAGIVPGIERFAVEDLQANLAVSLHAANDELRNRLVPANRHYPIEQLVQACRAYADRTHRRVTFETALIDGVNDSIADARETARRLAGLLCHVNLIPFNPIPELRWKPSPADRVRAFERTLSRAGVPVTVRESRGSEIQAGCGQLRAREMKQH
jgi:23S rRNA (adenine2503-C2)-methyltransferase